MKQRIVAIMAHQRSGTHLLGSSMATHPEIKYTGEIFRQSVPRHRGEVVARIERVRGGGFPVICLDTKYNQISAAVEAYLAQPEVKVIHLVRRNVLRLYFSGELHTWRAQHRQASQLPVFAFDESRFVRLRDSIERHIQRIGHLADLELYYEDLTGDQDISELPEWAARQICLLCGVDYQPMAVQIRKEAPVDIGTHLAGVPSRIARYCR